MSAIAKMASETVFAFFAGLLTFEASEQKTIQQQRREIEGEEEEKIVTEDVSSIPIVSLLDFEKRSLSSKQELLVPHEQVCSFVNVSIVNCSIRINLLPCCPLFN